MLMKKLKNYYQILYYKNLYLTKYKFTKNLKRNLQKFFYKV